MTEINEEPFNSDVLKGNQGDDTSNAVYSEEIDILGEQFQNYFLIAQALLKTLNRPRDIEICTILLQKVQRLNDNEEAEMRHNNNCFFRYYLKVLKWTSDNQPCELYHWYRNQDKEEDGMESRAWLEENKSHMALKLLKDGSTVIYGAISNDPSAGWQDGGLNFLAKRGLCLKNL